VGLIAVVADRVGIADQVEPPGGHPLGMPRRGEQPLDELLVAIGRGVAEVAIDLLRRGRHPGQVEISPPQECQRIGVGRRSKPLLFE